MKKDPSPARQVVCPACGGPSIYSQSNPFRPFCSERCKNNDLGAWANEDFRLPAETPPDDPFYGDPKLQ
ncbi:MAG: DNA gyrase inhibitor YacG [Polaromonas sp.]